MYGKEINDIQAEIRHCQFVDRLVYKSSLYSNTKIYVISEAYTTKSCTECLSLNTKKINNLKTRQTASSIECKDCGFKIHRDYNGSRNMILKWLS